MNNVMEDFGSVSIVPHLPPNAIVKWSRWLEWTDAETLEPWGRYSIRFTVVPDDFVAAANAEVCSEPKRCFISILDMDGENERDVTTFVFVTFAVDAVGWDDIRALRRDIFRGQVRLAHKPEGDRPKKVTDGDLCFVDTVRFMARWQNYDRAYFLKTGQHAKAGQITRMFDER